MTCLVEVSIYLEVGEEFELLSRLKYCQVQGRGEVCMRVRVEVFMRVAFVISSLILEDTDNTYIIF